MKKIVAQNYLAHGLAALAGLALLVLVLAPAAAQAQDFSWFKRVAVDFNQFIDALIPALYALAFLAFIWGVIQYFIFGAGDEEKRAQGRSFMLYALIGLLAITALYGVLALLAGWLGINTATDTTNFKGIIINDPTIN